MSGLATPEIKTAPQIDLKDSKIDVGPKLGAGAFGDVYIGEYAEKVNAAKPDSRTVIEYYPSETVAFKIQSLQEPSATEDADETLHEGENEKTLYVSDHPTVPQFSQHMLHKRIKEAQVMQLLSQENRHVVPIISYGVDAKGRFVTVMPFYEEGSLRNWIKKRKGPDPILGVQFLSQVASALQCAHNHRAIHRDVKPDNILFKTSEFVMLGDFGIATPEIPIGTTEQDEMKKINGTPHYMAPEQLVGRTSIYSDQYALGIVMYELLVGHTPYKGDFMNIMKGHLAKEAVPSFESITNRPLSIEARALEPIIQKAVSKDWRNRYPSITRFVEALQDALYDCLPREEKSQFPDVAKRANAQRYAQQAAQLYYQHNYENAVKAYDQAIDLDPSSITARYQKSLTLHAMHKLHDAQLALVPIINCPVRTNAEFVMKGYALANLKQFAQAELAFTDAINRGYKNRAVFEYRAMALEDLGIQEENAQQYLDSHARYYQAIASFDQAIAVDPLNLANAETYKRKAIVLRKVGRYAEALQADTYATHFAEMVQIKYGKGVQPVAQLHPSESDLMLSSTRPIEEMQTLSIPKVTITPTIKLGTTNKHLRAVPTYVPKRE